MASVSTVSTVAQVPSEAIPTFKLIQPKSPFLNALRKIFNDVLEPLYGSQEEAIKKIVLAKDRKCYLLVVGDKPVGVLAFKTVLTDEFASFGIKNSLEIKSLFLVNADQNSGRGLGSSLMNKLIEDVSALKLSPASFHVTVSDNKKESLQFFMKKGFTQRYFWTGKYGKNKKEYLLSCALTSAGKEKADKIVLATNQVFVSKQEDSKKEKETILESERKERSCLAVLGHVQNAHWDDVHFLRKLSDGTFVSGSKDHALCKWDRNGKLVKTVRDVEPLGIDCKEWITALEVLNDEYWITGERNGRICLWSTDGQWLRDIHPKLPKSDHMSHPYNKRRVTCLAAGVNKQKLHFYIGFPTIFDEYSPVANKTVSTARVHKQDWVYCIRPIDETNVLAVRADCLEQWKKVNDKWELSKTLIQERPKVKLDEPPRTKKNGEPRPKRTRQHISAFVQLDSSANHFGLSVFGGYVKVFDIDQAKIIREWKEHTGNVWTIENVTREIFASSGEDGYVRLWDTRASQSVQNLKISSGEVTALMRYDESLFIAGSCSKEPIEVNEGAKLVYFDIRK